MSQIRNVIELSSHAGIYFHNLKKGGIASNKAKQMVKEHMFKTFNWDMTDSEISQIVAGFVFSPVVESLNTSIEIQEV